jgi:hypothetical protein
MATVAPSGADPNRPPRGRRDDEEDEGHQAPPDPQDDEEPDYNGEEEEDELLEEVERVLKQSKQKQPKRAGKTPEEGARTQERDRQEVQQGAQVDGGDSEVPEVRRTNHSVHPGQKNHQKHTGAMVPVVGHLTRNERYAAKDAGGGHTVLARSP